MLGGGASRFRNSSRIKAIAFNARGETLTTMEHRAGWDATFPAPRERISAALLAGLCSTFYETGLPVSGFLRLAPIPVEDENTVS